MFGKVPAKVNAGPPAVEVMRAGRRRQFGPATSATGQTEEVFHDATTEDGHGRGLAAAARLAGLGAAMALGLGHQ
jgi:hypothetical protein